MVLVDRLAVSLVLVWVGLLALGCTQPPSATPTPLPTVLASASNVPAAVHPSPFVAPSASAAPKTAVAHIASVKPSVLPSDAPVPALAPGVPVLADFVHSFNHAVNQAFNDSRVAYESSTDIWVMDNTVSDYQYTVYIQPSKTRNWGAFDVVKTVYGSSGVAKNASVAEGESGPYYKYDLTMKCFDAHYDVELTLFDYAHLPNSGQYRRTLGPQVMLTLADACPN